VILQWTDSHNTVRCFFSCERTSLPDTKFSQAYIKQEKNRPLLCTKKVFDTLEENRGGFAKFPYCHFGDYKKRVVVMQEKMMVVKDLRFVEQLGCE